MKALVTGAGAVLGQGIIKALEASELDCTIVAADPHRLSPGLYWADRAYRIPFADDPGFGAGVEDILDRERPDIILVGTDVELAWFAANREALERRYGTQVLVSDPRVVAIADDKFETYRFMKDAGFAPPESAKGDDPQAVAALVETVGFPLVVKPRVGARSVGVSVVHDAQGLRDAMRDRSGLVVQECVGDEGREYTASVLVFDGEAQGAIVMRRDLRDGNTHRAYVEEDPELHRAVCAFGVALGPHGPANFQFRTMTDGTPRVFEINARFSGTTPMRALAGFNEVEMCIAKLLLNRTIVQPKIRPGVVLRFLEERFVTQSQIDAID